MEPIVIVGMGCRLPGECNSPSKLWDLLEAGKSAHSRVPPSRFNIDAWYHPESHRQGFVHASGGYFLSNDESHLQFDPSFFGISPLEARSIDPQQRKFLEVVYETFESAGVTLQDVSDSETACYVGCFTADHKVMNQRSLGMIVPYQLTGSDLTIISNRINYVFNLKGPSLTVDTACSSSLYALHLACQSLRAGDCKAAIVGGTNIVLGVEQHLATSSLGVLSPTSRCHTFDESADGFARADGITAIYIKTLSAAIANGDPIRGVIRSTAINSNGKSSGINHPETHGQEAVIRKAYTNAGLHYRETGFFECHGTGTPVGDPIECTAVGNVFADGRNVDQPLLLGSIKTNIGHTEGASGIASVIKCVLSLEKATVPANAGFSRLNSRIDLRNGSLSVVQDTVPWPRHQPYLRASVNSFGYGGANAHVILDSTQSYFGRYHSRPRNDSCFMSYQPPLPEVKRLLVFSAHTKQTLKQATYRILNDLHRHELRDVAHTLSEHRSRLPHRCFLIAKQADNTLSSADVIRSHGYDNGKMPTIAFMFTGQGAQWPRMGFDLVQRFHSVRKTFLTLQSTLNELPFPPRWKILDELSKSSENSKVYDAELSQPLGTAVQIALVDLFRMWGIHPEAVTAHSSGEVAAAYAAGAITASEAITIAYCRGIAVARRSRPGAMLAVGLGAHEVETFLRDHPSIVIACHNSPNSVSLSGLEREIDQLIVAFKDIGIFARKVNSSGNAYHSPLVKEAAHYLSTEFGLLLPQRSVADSHKTIIPMYSCVTADKLKAEDFGVKHWLRNLEDSVLFNQATQAMLRNENSIDLVIEIGPHSALSGPFRQILSVLKERGKNVHYLPTLVRGKDGVDNVLALAGNLFTYGYPVKLGQVNLVEQEILRLPGDIRLKQENGRFLFDLPTYPWIYGDTLWSESRLSRAVRFRTYANHDLLGTVEYGSSLKSSTPQWRNYLRLKDVPWIADHKIGHDIIFPAAGYAAMVIEALQQVIEERHHDVHEIKLSELQILVPLLMPAVDHIETILNFQALSGVDAMSFSFVINSISAEGRSTEHVRGITEYEIRSESEEGTSYALNQTTKTLFQNEIEEMRNRNCGQTSNDERLYHNLAKLGLNYGPEFQPLTNITRASGGKGALARVSTRRSETESRYILHPILLDGCLQLSFLSTVDRNTHTSTKPYLPVEFRKLWIKIPRCIKNDYVIVHARARFDGLRDASGSFAIHDSDGTVMAEAEVSFKSVEGGFGSNNESPHKQPYARLVWKERKLDQDAVFGPKNGYIYHMQEAHPEDHFYYLVYLTSPHTLVRTIQKALEHADIRSHVYSLAETSTLPKSARLIFFGELERSLLAEATSIELEAIQRIFRIASSIVWVTSSGLLSGESPNKAVMTGIAKTIRTEQPAMKLYTIDLDLHGLDSSASASILLSQVRAWEVDNNGLIDLDLVVKDGVVYTSRFVMDDAENSKYFKSNSFTLNDEHLSDHCDLNFHQVGKIDTFYFAKRKKPVEGLSPLKVLVKPLAWSLSKSDTLVLKGSQYTSKCIYECIGQVVATGDAVTKVRDGSRVMCLARTQFETLIIVNEGLCVAVEGVQAAYELLGSLLSSCTVVNVLEQVSNIAAGEFLLLHDLHIEFVRTIVLLTQALNLKILVTYQNEADEEFLQKLLSFNHVNIFPVKAVSLERHVLAVTSGKGPQIIIAASTDAMMKKLWNLLPSHGKLLVTGNGSKPNFSGGDFSAGISRGASIITYNLAEMLTSQPRKLGDLLQKTLQILRTNPSLVAACETSTFDISHLPEAVETATKNTMGNRVLVEFASDSVVPTLYVPPQVEFCPDASYLLVGCLGGLGRSLAMWMAEHGARNFVFLSRSGTDKSTASALVEDLQALLRQSKNLWSVEVVCGDVSIRSDVNRAITAAKSPIKGVVQASMVLDRYLFTEIPFTSWKAILAPKVLGTENLHSAFQDQDLDFFVMTSSSIGILGLPTQGAYAAANAFLDGMARHRWKLGLQACSVALGMVTGIGHVAENPQIKDALSRYGSYPINEDEFLAAMQVACKRRSIPVEGSLMAWGPDYLAGAHLIMGLDLEHGRQQMVHGSAGMRWHEDSRLQELVSQLESSSSNDETISSFNSSNDGNPLSQLHQTYSAHSSGPAKSLLITFLTTKFSTLTHVNIEKVEEGIERPLSVWGMDSLIGSELRNWAWASFKVDVPFMGLLEGGWSLKKLNDIIWLGLAFEKGRDTGIEKVEVE